MISMNKPQDSLLKWLVLLNPPLDLFQPSNNFSLGSVKRSLFNIIGAVAREHHLPKVKGVEVVIIFQIWSK
jgi:hypothetical protein